MPKIACQVDDLPKYFIGTSQSSTYLSNSNTGYDGYTDALINARTMALEKFISQFRPQVSWMEIELIPLKDESKYKEIKNLINHSRYEAAKFILYDYSEPSLVSDKTERGKILFSLSVVESLLGNYAKAKSLIHEAHRLFPDERIMEFLDKIDKMELESRKISMIEET